MKLETNTVTLRKLTPSKEGMAIVKKEDYERELSGENQTLPEDEKFTAHRSTCVYLGKDDGEENYMEIVS